MHEKLLADGTVGVIPIRFNFIYLYFKKYNNLLFCQKESSEQTEEY